MGSYKRSCYWKDIIRLWSTRWQCQRSKVCIRLTRQLIHGNFLKQINTIEKLTWKCSYQRADPNFVMLTPSKAHLAEGIQWKSGKRPMMQSDVNSGNFDGVPRELRPLGKLLWFCFQLTIIRLEVLVKQTVILLENWLSSFTWAFFVFVYTLIK